MRVPFRRVGVGRSCCCYVAVVTAAAARRNGSEPCGTFLATDFVAKCPQKRTITTVVSTRNTHGAIKPSVPHLFIHRTDGGQRAPAKVMEVLPFVRSVLRVLRFRPDQHAEGQPRHSVDVHVEAGRELVVRRQRRRRAHVPLVDQQKSIHLSRNFTRGRRNYKMMRPRARRRRSNRSVFVPCVTACRGHPPPTSVYILLYGETSEKRTFSLPFFLPGQPS